VRLGSSVTLRPQTLERSGRTVAELIEAVNLNLAMVEDGQAFAYRKCLGHCNAQPYLDAEVRVSRRRVGVWQVCR
jgi:endonuclease YncB( thermonuclease family)